MKYRYNLTRSIRHFLMLFQTLLDVRSAELLASGEMARGQPSLAFQSAGFPVRQASEGLVCTTSQVCISALPYVR